MLAKIRSWFKKLPEHKPYLELITGLLTIPVLITVILLNFTNIRGRDDKPQSPPQAPIIIEESESLVPNQSPESVSTPNPEVCKKEVGPVSIVSPGEGEEVSGEPVNFVIRYDDSSYCSVVWSYRINNGSWSEFSSNSPVVYNLPAGSIKFELRVQSTASSDKELLMRNFTYKSSLQPTPTPSP